jgi:hypothetical protein
MPFNGIKNKKHPQTYSINQTKCALHPFNNKNGIRISRKGRWKERNLKTLPCGHNFTKMISIHDDLRGMKTDFSIAVPMSRMPGAGVPAAGR